MINNARGCALAALILLAVAFAPRAAGAAGHREVRCADIPRGSLMVALAFGQSNSANFAQTRSVSKSNVFSYYGGRCYVAQDPMPGATGIGGSVWPVLGDKVSEVRESKMLRDSPCRLVSPDNTPGRDMQRVYRLLNQEYEVPPKVIEINRGHPLIYNLTSIVTHKPDDPVIDLTIEQLYENQLLLEGLHPNPAAMISRIQTLMETATAQND